MRSTLDLMNALGGNGVGTRPIVRPPTLIRPYPPGQAPPEDDIAQNMRGELPQYLPGGIGGPSAPVPPNVPGPRPGELPLMPRMAEIPYTKAQPIPPRLETKPYDGSIFNGTEATPLPGGMKGPEMPTEGPNVAPPADEAGLGHRFLAALGQSLGRAGRAGRQGDMFMVSRSARARGE